MRTFMMYVFIKISTLSYSTLGYKRGELERRLWQQAQGLYLLQWE